MKRAAGVLLAAEDGNVLILRRMAGEHSGEWAFPAGGIEDGETAEAAARRELEEETGLKYDGPLRQWATQVADGLFFTTFSARVERFEPKLNGEHMGYAWAKPQEAIKDFVLHPGAKAALQKLEWDELGVANAIRSGALASPQRYANVLLVALRITGTGKAYRLALDEHVWRGPELYLNDQFVARCNGLPVILEHPAGGTELNGAEFRDRIIGTVLLPYLQDDEVWGIAKIYDEAAAEVLENEKVSTSPCIVFSRADPGTKVPVEGGGTLLIEGKPSFVDHVAICIQGVWDKTGEPSGVSNQVSNPQQESAPMADESKDEKREESKADAEVKADAAKIDRVLAHLDSLHKRMDAYERKDSEEDEEEEEDQEERADSKEEEEEKEEKKDSKRKDAKRKDSKRKDSKRADGEDQDDNESSEEGLEEERKENKVKRNDKRSDAGCTDSRSDAVLNGLKAEIEALRAAMPKVLDEEDRKRFVATQLEWEQVAQAFGDSQGAPRWANGESLHEYVRRLAGKYQSHSTSWKDRDLSKMDASILEVAASQIRSDALSIARNPPSVEGAPLRMSEERDGTNRIIRKFHGDPMACWGPFMQPYRYITGWNSKQGAAIQ